jgi:hypothetical protein
MRTASRSRGVITLIPNVEETHDGNNEDIRTEYAN